MTFAGWHYYLSMAIAVYFVLKTAMNERRGSIFTIFGTIGREEYPSEFRAWLIGVYVIAGGLFLTAWAGLRGL